VSPEHVVVVPVDLEQLLVAFRVGLGWEYFLEVSHARQLLFRFEQDQPILGAQNIQATAVVQLVQVVYILGVESLVLVAVVKQPLLLLLPQLLQTLLRVVLDPNDVQDVRQQRVLDLAVHWRGRTQRGTDVDLHQPGFKFIVDEDIEAVELKAAVPFFLCLGVDVEHDRLGADACLDDNLFNLVEKLCDYSGTFSELMPLAS
jgi:hypothetical protein